MEAKEYLIKHHNLIIASICLIISIILLHIEENKLLDVQSTAEYKNIQEDTTKSSVEAKANNYAYHADILINHISVCTILLGIAILLSYLSTQPRFQKLHNYFNRLAEILFLILPLYMIYSTIYIIYITITDYQKASSNDLKAVKEHRTIIIILTTLFIISTYELCMFFYKKFIQTN